MLLYVILLYWYIGVYIHVLPCLLERAPAPDRLGNFSAYWPSNSATSLLSLVPTLDHHLYSILFSCRYHIKMSVLRPFRATDMFKFNNMYVNTLDLLLLSLTGLASNLDIWTETVHFIEPAREKKT
jgi:hypothetical protein